MSTPPAKPRYPPNSIMYKKVNDLFRQRGLLGQDLADKMGVDPAKVTLWAQGRWWPKPHHMFELAQFLKLPMEYLVDDTMKEPPKGSASAESLSEEERFFLMIGRDVGFKEALRRIFTEPTLRELLNQASKRSKMEIREPVGIKVCGNFAGSEPPDDEAEMASEVQAPDAPRSEGKPSHRPRVKPRSLGPVQDIPTGRDRLDREKEGADAPELPHR